MIDSQPFRLFYSYSHEDDRLRNELETHLKILQRQGLIQEWHDRNITGGSEWENKICEHLESAHIILLLISANFVASQYCYDIEMKRALEKHHEGSARVIPVLLRDVDWHGAPFARLQALPTGAKPVTNRKWRNHDEAWTDVTKGIRRVIEELRRTHEHPSEGSRNPISTRMTDRQSVQLTEDDPPWFSGIIGDSLPPLIVSNAPLIRVVAGPGSGKTTGLKRRVQRLVQHDGILPSRIFVGTFTRAVASELQSTLEVEVDYQELADESSSVQVSTLHSLAYRLLQQYPAACSGRSFRFLLEFEEQAMLYDIGKALPELASQTVRKNRLNQTLAEWADGKDLLRDRFAGELERWLRWHEGMLIGEVVKLAQRALETGDIPKGLFDHVIIDEYQDLTCAEQLLVAHLWSHQGSLVILGDDDQSIYSFRFNHPRGVTEFVDSWRGTDILDIQLSENRRSQHSIVDLANQMMAQAGPTKPPMINVREADPSQLALVFWPTIEAEFSGLKQFMLKRPDEEFLVLVPRRFIGYRLQSAIGPSASTSFHQELLESSLVRERVTAAALLANPSDRVALRAWFGFKGHQAEDAPQRNASAYESVRKQRLSGRQLVEAIAEGAFIPKGTGRTHIQARARTLLELWQRTSGSLDESLSFLFDPSLADTIEDPEKRLKVSSDLELLRDGSLEIASLDNTQQLWSVLARVRYRIATRTPLVLQKKTRIQIMTLHGAKGLEADNVIVAGMTDQIIPGILPDNPYDAERYVEEQRRLLYVSITRARDSLVVSWPQTMTYRDAKSNQVRTDKNVARTANGELIVQLGASSLLPQAHLAIPGKQWLTLL